MSFSKEIKEEICSVKEASEEEQKPATEEQQMAMAYGMLLFSKSFSASAIALTTESRAAAATYSETIAALTGTIVEMRVKLTHRRGESKVYTLTVPDRNDCASIFDRFGHQPSQLNLRINRANIDGENGTAYFLRGVFLVCGSVTNPDKDYHMEFAVPYKNLAADLERIISEIDEIKPEPHTIRRQGSYVVYLKGCELIADILTYIGAPMAALNMMQSSMMKSLRNRINRRTNSETANLKKTADASARQLIAIERIRQKQGLASLPADLRELAEMRLEYPEYNLRELGEALSVPISRSGVNHRLQRLMAIAEALNDS